MIIFLYGEDTFRSRRKLKELQDKFLREIDPRGLSLHRIDGAEVRTGAVGELVAPPSLFAKKRMAIIENIFSNKDQTIWDELLSFFKNGKADDNIVIFWDETGENDRISQAKSGLFAFLTKQRYTQKFPLLSNTQVIEWTRQEAEARGGRISRQACVELASLSGSDLWQINNEIDKLLAYCRGHEPQIVKNAELTVIETEDVKNMVRGSLDENIFALTDAISKKNKALAVRLFEEQTEAGLAGGYLLAMITRQFRILLGIRQALDAGSGSRKIISQLKLHPFVVQKGIGQARNFTLPVIKKILNRLTDIDREVKTGRGEPSLMLSTLIAAL